LRVIDAVAWPYVDTKLPHTISAWLVVAEIAQLEAVHASVNGDLCLDVLHLVAPVCVHVAAVVGDVVPDLEQG
jgi:hypothetical protein